MFMLTLKAADLAKEAAYLQAVDKVKDGIHALIKDANQGGSDGAYESAAAKIGALGEQLDKLKAAANKDGIADSSVHGYIDSVRDDIEHLTDDSAEGTERGRALWGGKANVGGEWYGDDEPPNGDGSWEEGKHPRADDGKWTHKSRHPLLRML